MTTSLGREIDRFSFVAPFFITPLLGILGFGALAGFVRSGGLTMIPIAAGALYWAWHYFARAPRLLSIRDGGLVVHRGFGGEHVPWSALERVVFGKPDGLRHGVHLVYSGGRHVAVLSGNVGQRKTRAIAERIVAAAGVDPNRAGLG